MLFRSRSSDLEGEALRGRGSVAWKGKRCVEGKALRGRESVALPGRCGSKPLRAPCAVCHHPASTRVEDPSQAAHYLPDMASASCRHVLDLVELVHVNSGPSLAHVAQREHPVPGEPARHAAAPVSTQPQSTTGPCGPATHNFCLLTTIHTAGH